MFKVFSSIYERWHSTHRELGYQALLEIEHLILVIERLEPNNKEGVCKIDHKANQS